MLDEQSVLAVIRAARPTFRNAHDKVAFVVHASFIASGYVLHATGPPAFSDDVLSFPTTDEVGIEQWNEFEDDYAFLYSNPDKGSKKALVKCLTMNDKLLVDALNEGGFEPVHLETNVGDYARENGGTNYASHFKDLGKLVSRIEKEILSKLNGTLKEPLSTQRSSPTQPSSSITMEFEVTGPPAPQSYPAGIAYPPVNPVGGSDLFPGPGAGVFPTRGDFGSGNFGRGGGMFVGPDHPLFGGIGSGRDPGLPGGLPGVPPGARFDPYGPPGVPGFEPNPFIRGPRRPGSDPHPDLEPFRDGSDYI
ncbi:hypothetical protein U1Q18_013432 [Sarracenia purpurea var. burkii]